MENDRPDPLAIDRRSLLKGATAAGLAPTLNTVAEGAEKIANAFTPAPPPAPAAPLDLSLQINGEAHRLTVEPRVTLLDALRERLDLTGTKKGCDHGQCGACTVHLDGRRVLACLTLAAQAEGAKITTVEGLAQGDELHPMQKAFIDHDGFQCGYCTPGQICSAVAMLEEVKQGQASAATPNLEARTAPTPLSDEEIRERMSGNLCRCGAYNGIVAAVKQAAGVNAE